MFYPELVLAHHVYFAKLASFPVDSQLLLAGILCYVFGHLVMFEGSSTLFTRLEMMRKIALVEEMLGEVPQVYQRVASLTVGQNFALSDVVIFLIFEGLAAVCANIVLLNLFAFLVSFKHSDFSLSIIQPIQFAVLEGLFVD